MSKAMGWRYPFGLTVLAMAAAIAVGTTAQADVSTEQSGSILVFPKVLNASMCEGGEDTGRVCESPGDCPGSTCSVRDTVIQISNTGNTLVYAHCFYTNAAPQDPSFPPGPTNPPRWQETDFFLWLTKQQPTHWTASDGRAVYPLDSPGSDGAGLDPGAVPPVASGFMGELMCVEVGVDGLPVSGNHLKGEATLKNVETGDVSKYAGLAIAAGPNAGATGRDMALDNDQYNSCPNTLLLNHFTDGVQDPVIGPPNDFGACSDDECRIDTELTLIPCARDFENQIGGRANVLFFIINEFEEQLSAQTVVDCWLNADLSTIHPNAFSAATRGTLTAYTRITHSDTRDLSGQLIDQTGGLLGVAEEAHLDTNGITARAAFNLQIEGSRFDQGAQREIIDHIVLTGEE